MLKSSCHCGAIQIEIDSLPKSLTQCTCSICRRYASLWGYYTRSSARASFEADAVTVYQWNDRVIEFYSCKSCGCVTHYEGVDKTPNERLAVNFRMFPLSVWQNLDIKTFDGADTWKYLDDSASS